MMANNKRQRLGDDGEYTPLWTIPVVFRIFAGKSHKLDDIELHVYGSAEEPTFLVSDIGKLGALGSATNIAARCNDLAGTLFRFYLHVHLHVHIFKCDM
jgi:hypothetical protein